MQSRGGINRQAVAAIENALLDIKGKALGVPVYDLFGGKLRERIPVYWSHCGCYRMRNPELVGMPRGARPTTISRVGEEVKGRGFTALKTNIVHRDRRQELTAYRPGFGVGKGFPERNWDAYIARSAATTRSRPSARACGPDVGIMLDLNFNYRTEGFLRIADAVGPARLTWLEIDTHDPEVDRADAPRRALPDRLVRDAAASAATSGRIFEAYAMDTAIIDVIWNGFTESLKIAAMADVYEMNVAPHNFYGHLASAISAHFCAAVPNFRIMETDIDAVPWRDEIVDAPPVIENGEFVLPTGPGWGVEVNEAGVRAHPPK